MSHKYDILTQTIDTQIKFLCVLHKNVPKLRNLHRRLTLEMLQWPQPFLLTEGRQTLYAMQQQGQNTPDLINIHLSDISQLLDDILDAFVSRGQTLV